MGQDSAAVHLVSAALFSLGAFAPALTRLAALDTPFCALGARPAYVDGAPRFSALPPSGRGASTRLSA